MTAPIQFRVSAADVHRHLFEVEMTIPEVDDEELVVKMPVWSPGSYLIREYPRHVQNVKAETAEGEARASEKLDKASWRIDSEGAETIVVRYELFAHTLGVRYNHLDDTHGFFHGPATYMYPEGRKDSAVELEVVPPSDRDWRVFCSLDPMLEDGTDEDDYQIGDATRFEAPDFDTFLDAPVEMGDHDVVRFEVEGVPHTMVFWGEGNWDAERLERDVPEIVEANADIFGGLPYDRYLFITLLSDGARGGLEHLDSTALIFPQDGFGKPPRDGGEPPVEDEDYLDFLGLVAHEHFHVWNVKRIRPKRLGPFDYQRENYTRDLWTIEGMTSLYDRKALLRSGLIERDKFFDIFANRIRHYEKIPGRKVHSLEEASFDAWIKAYRRDEHTVNSSVSYYLKGALAAFALELRLLLETDGERSLDDMLQKLWNDYYLEGRGYEEGEYEALVEELAGADLEEFFDDYIRGTAEFDWSDILAPFGLKLTRSYSEDATRARLGVRTTVEEGRLKVKSVPDDTPAARDGIYAGDEIVALDGWRIGEDDLDERLAMFEPGDTVDVTVFRRDKLVSRDVTLDEAPYDTYEISVRDDATDEQRRRLETWLPASR